MMSVARLNALWQRIRSAFDLYLHDEHFREVFRDTYYGFLLRIGGGGLAFGSNWLMARELGPDGVGVYYLAFTTVTVLAVLSRLGLADTCVRYASPAFVTDDWETVIAVRRTATALVTVISLISAIILAVVAPFVSHYVFHEPQLANALRIMAIALVPLSLLNIDAGMLQAAKRIPASTVVQAAAVPGTLLILLAFVGYFSMTPAIATACYTLATIVVFVGGRTYWMRVVQKRAMRANYYDSRRLLTTGLRIMGVNSIGLIMAWTDTVCLGIWRPASEVGLYGIAVRTALLTSLVLSAANSAVGPKFAQLSAQHNISGLRTLIQKTSFGMAAIAVPVTMVMLIFPKIILGLFGQKFVAAHTVLIILAVGQFVSVVTGTVGHLMMMSGYEKSLRNIVAFSAILNVILNVMLVPSFGMIGAAVAMAASMILMSALCVASVRKNLGIWSLPKW